MYFLLSDITWTSCWHDQLNFCITYSPFEVRIEEHKPNFSIEVFDSRKPIHLEDLIQQDFLQHYICTISTIAAGQTS